MKKSTERRRRYASGIWFVSLVLATGLSNQAAADTGSKSNTDPGAKECLATAIYFEARGEPPEGQKAVAQVVMNRVRDNAFPDTVCGVVYQNQSMANRCQFSFACDGVPDKPAERRAWEKAQEIADLTLSGTASAPGLADATHYHATTVKPRWSSRLKLQQRIGRHVFYSS